MDDAATRQTTSELTEPLQAYDLFVVHAPADADFVRGYLLPALNLPSSRVLLVDELPPGGVRVAEIDRGVSRSRYTVAVLSPAYLIDRWAVFGEQLASHLSVENVHVIPLQLTDCELPLRLQARISLDFTNRKRWETEARRLRDLLHTQPPVAEAIACPYPGMRAFAAAEFGRFFGRHPEIEDLIARLDRGERAIYVIGPSGSGKSSLVQAGLLHVLEASVSRLGRSFIARTMRPGERPTERLAKALEGDLATPAQTVQALVARHPPAERALVFIDQLEEVFALASAEERQRFIEALHTLRTETPCCFVLALRADFYGALMDSALWPWRASLSRLDIAPLRGEALAEAITTPAMRVGVHIDARLCDRLVVHAAEEPGVLPLVQETLRMLWDKRRYRYLGLAEYEALGNGGRGLDVAIARRANAAMSELTDTQQAIARRVLLRLVSLGEGRVDTRRQLSIPALRSAADQEAELSSVLQHLVAHRLITVDGDQANEQPSREALVDLSHEALITGWPELQRWINECRADEQRRRRLEEKVSEWIERGRGTASLLDAVELAEAVQWMASDAAQALGHTAGFAELIAASRTAHSRQRRRRRSLLGGAFTVLAGFAVVVAVLAIDAREQASKAREEESKAREAETKAREAAIKAEASNRKNEQQLAQSYMESGRQLLLNGHPQEAVPYLVAAREHGEEGKPLKMMFATVTRHLPLVLIFDPNGNVWSAGFSPDGTRIVTASDDKMARVWDAETGNWPPKSFSHQGEVWSAAFSPDGTRIVTASKDKTARVWDAATGKPLTNPLGHQAEVVSAAFSPDGTRVVTASKDKTARVWNAATGEPLTSPLEHQAEVVSAAFSPNGTRVVTASKDKTARVWDAATGKPLTSLEHQAEVVSAAFSPDGTHVVTASGNTAGVWDAATGKPLPGRFEHQAVVVSAAFSPDGTRVVTASKDKTARVWDAATGKPLTNPLEHQAEVVSAAFSPDGTRLVTASKDRTARVWDAATGEPLTSPLEHQAEVVSAAFSPNGTRVVTASKDNTTRIWDAATSKPFTTSLEHHAAVVNAAFSPDGRRVVTASNDKTARVWDAATGKPLTNPLGHQAEVVSAAFSPDGTRVVTASKDKTARVWDAKTGKPLTSPLEHHAEVVSAAFSPDGRRVVTASKDNTARIWDAKTGKPLTSPLEHQAEVVSVAFSPDGTHVITASKDKTARVWDAVTGTPFTSALAQYEGEVVSAAFSPDGRRVVTANKDRSAWLWDVATGETMPNPLDHQGPVTSVAFSPDGTRVVTASDDHTARVWLTAEGEPLTSPLGHEGTVRSVAFSPDGTRVVTASDDKTARVWDAATGNPLTSPLEHQGTVRSAAFSPDGTRVVTASDDKTARVWDVRLDEGTLEQWSAVAKRSPLILSGSRGSRGSSGSALIPPGGRF